jgi:hypothetical protein
MHPFVFFHLQAIQGMRALAEFSFMLQVLTALTIDSRSPEGRITTDRQPRQITIVDGDESMVWRSNAAIGLALRRARQRLPLRLVPHKVLPITSGIRWLGSFCHRLVRCSRQPVALFRPLLLFFRKEVL